MAALEPDWSDDYTFTRLALRKKILLTHRTVSLKCGNAIILTDINKANLSLLLNYPIDNHKNFHTRSSREIVPRERNREQRQYRIIYMMAVLH